MTGCHGKQSSESSNKNARESRKSASNDVQTLRPEESILEQVRRSAKGCKYVFFDLGSNRQVHIRWLFDAPEYQALDRELGSRGDRKCLHKMFERFDHWYGPASVRSQPFNVSKICAFGFEANPQQVTKTTATEAHFKCKVDRIEFRALAVALTLTSVLFCCVVVNNHGRVFAPRSSHLLLFGLLMGRLLSANS